MRTRTIALLRCLPAQSSVPSAQGSMAPNLHCTLTKLFEQFVDDVVAAVRSAAAEGMQAAEAAVAEMVDAFVKSVETSAVGLSRRGQKVPRRTSSEGPLPTAASPRGRRRQKKPAPGP